MNKLFVAGCSVSDYTNVDVVYGEILSKKLNYEYVHEAAGCGSNWRIWRRITNYILNGDLTSNSILIVQYTNFERREFWSQFKGYCDSVSINGKQYLRDIYGYNNGEITRFKIGSYNWQEENEKLFHKLYEENFLNPEFEKEIFDTQHLMFQCLLKEYSIPTIFIELNGYIKKNEVNYISHFENHVIDINDVYIQENLSDCCHFNENGHLIISNILYDFIIENKKKLIYDKVYR